jgi:hypothetical protein
LKSKFKSFWGKVTGKKEETTIVEYVEDEDVINTGLFPEDDNFSVGGMSNMAQKDGQNKKEKAKVELLYSNATDDIPSTSFF